MKNKIIKKEEELFSYQLTMDGSDKGAIFFTDQKINTAKISNFAMFINLVVIDEKLYLKIRHANVQGFPTSYTLISKDFILKRKEKDAILNN